MRKKLYFILMLLFVILCFAGAIYVIANGGQPNAGYAVVPMLWGSIFSMLYQGEKRKEK